MRMIVHQMDIKKEYRVELQKYPTNLYRDDKMKTAIQSFLMNSQANVAMESSSGMMQDQNFLASSFKSCMNKTTDGKQPVNMCSLPVPPGTLLSFQKHKLTKVYPLQEIVKKELGKSGVESFNRMRDDLARKEMQEGNARRNGGKDSVASKGPVPMVMKGTLQLKNDKCITKMEIKQPSSIPM